MKKSLLAAAASLTLISGAQAADIIEPTAYDWTGPYVGLQGGYGWGENDVSVDGSEGEPTITIQRVEFHPLKDGSIDMDGFVGGLHAGYNWQSDSLVLGVEGDIEFADIDGDTDIIHVDNDNEDEGDASQEIDWLGSLRLRAGFAFDRALLYATGGLAVGGVKVEASLAEASDASNKDTEWGWTVGGGLEYAPHRRCERPHRISLYRSRRHGSRYGPFRHQPARIREHLPTRCARAELALLSVRRSRDGELKGA